MTHSSRGFAGLLMAAVLLYALVVPGSAAPVRAEARILHLPLVVKAFTPTIFQVSGRVLLEGRTDYAGATLAVNGIPAAQTDSQGNFRFSWVARAPVSSTVAMTLTAHCPAYLWAQTVLAATIGLGGPTVFQLPDVTLLGGDVAASTSTVVTPTQGCPNTDPVDVPDVADPFDGEEDIVNIIDTTMVSRHSGVNNTVSCTGVSEQCWGPDPCFPAVPHLGYRADINGDGYVDNQDLAIVYRNVGKSAPLNWVTYQ